MKGAAEVHTMEKERPQREVAMHPLLLLALLFALRNGRANSGYIWRPPVLPRLSMPFPTYFDTFRMEMMLDKMRTLTDALDKVNHLRQIDQSAAGRSNAMERIGESLEVAKAFLADTKAERKIDQMAGAVDTLRQVSDPSGWMAAAGPLLSGLGNLKDFEGK